VRSVEKGSRADKAGFRAGDVIFKVNDEQIHDSGDFSHALRSRKDNTASISFIRDKKEQTITITLPEHKQSELRQSFEIEIPAIDAKSREELSQLTEETAHLKPEMEEAINRQIQQVQPEIERQTRDAQRRAQQYQRQMRDLQRELRDQRREIERELRQAIDGSSSEL
jgi:membrane-associated protease RseP (regulator of RpoE activity)